MMNLLWRRCILLFLIAGNAYADAPTILVLGDSISAAYGINTDQGWVALLQKQLQENAYKYRVINASVSGDTTRTGLNRLPAALLQHKPEILVAALGGNDGLRGLPFSEIESSLSQIIELGRKNHAQVILVGVRLPPNYGEAYTRQFAELYLRLGKKYKIRVVPRLLDKVADQRELLQPDGIHPTAEGQAQIMHNVWVELEPLLLGVKE
ncbi:MAG: arylesterase [Gammaproteobacteria bacterium]